MDKLVGTLWKGDRNNWSSRHHDYYLVIGEYDGTAFPRNYGALPDMVYEVMCYEFGKPIYPRNSLGWTEGQIRQGKRIR